MKNRFAAAFALLLALPLSAQQPPKPPIDKPPLAPPTADASKEKEKEAPKWDVANPPYPYDNTVQLDLTAGTWMSLDVSRTGRRSSSIFSGTSTRCRSGAVRRRR